MAASAEMGKEKKERAVPEREKKRSCRLVEEKNARCRSIPTKPAEKKSPGRGVRGGGEPAMRKKGVGARKEKFREKKGEGSKLEYKEGKKLDLRYTKRRNQLGEGEKRENTADTIKEDVKEKRSVSADSQRGVPLKGALEKGEQRSAQGGKGKKKEVHKFHRMIPERIQKKGRDVTDAKPRKFHHRAFQGKKADNA